MDKSYIIYKDAIAFHPGYYIKELVEESGLTQEDFAKRLDTTPKNLSLLIRGEQNLSIDIAMKLSRMIGTSVEYWLNLQSAYDSLVARFKSDEELEAEKKVFNLFNYKYFRDNFGLPDLLRQVNEQIKALRLFLNVSTLTVLTKKDMSVSFRSSSHTLSDASIVKANAMVQIATNIALKTDAPPYNKNSFESAINYALTLTKNHQGFYPLVKNAFNEAGVIFVILPNIPGSNINGATKKLGKNIMLMVNDRNLYADSFWFSLFHEIGHIINGDYGISFDKEKGEKESDADLFAENNLIPLKEYNDFISRGKFSLQDIKSFALQIDRDPGIVLGRLQNDELVERNDWTLKTLRKKYKVKTSLQ